MRSDQDILIGDVAAEIPMESWRLRRLADRGLCPAPRRVGRYRVFRREDIPAIRAAAIKAGFVMVTSRSKVVTA
jgi:DNA-binding transcriptional MerR regulator